MACGSGRSMTSPLSAKESRRFSPSKALCPSYPWWPRSPLPTSLHGNFLAVCAASSLPVTMTPPAAVLRVVSWYGPKRGASTQQWFRRCALTSTAIYASPRLTHCEREWQQFSAAILPASIDAIFLGSRLGPMATATSLSVKLTLDSVYGWNKIATSMRAAP